MTPNTSTAFDANLKINGHHFEFRSSFMYQVSQVLHRNALAIVLKYLPHGFILLAGLIFI